MPNESPALDPWRGQPKDWCVKVRELVTRHAEVHPRSTFLTLSEIERAGDRVIARIERQRIRGVVWKTPGITLKQWIQWALYDELQLVYVRRRASGVDPEAVIDANTLDGGGEEPEDQLDKRRTCASIQRTLMLQWEACAQRYEEALEAGNEKRIERAACALEAVLELVKSFAPGVQLTGRCPDPRHQRWKLRWRLCQAHPEERSRLFCLQAARAMERPYTSMRRTEVSDD